MGSTRLPGKVLKHIAGRPMMSYLIERLRRVRLAQRIVVATTTQDSDVAIVDFCRSEGVDCTRGSESDVLSRYFEAAQLFQAEAVVRVTSDCPLIDPELIDTAIDVFSIPGQGYDYVSNMIEPTWPYGMAVEVFSGPVLAEAHREAVNPAEREHVTPFIYWRPEKYRLRSLTMQPNLSHHRWTVDVVEDFDLISRILENVYADRADFDMNDVLTFLERHPEWAALNAHVQQKPLIRN